MKGSGDSVGDIHIGRKLKHIRTRAGLTQAELAGRMGIGQTALSHLESREDMLLSTLRTYVAAVGGTLRVSSYAFGEDPLVANIDESELTFDEQDEDQLLLPMLGDRPVPPRKDVIFSIKPVYSDRILEGSKQVELRRRFPKRVPRGTHAIIYSTTPVRAMVGMAEIYGVDSGSPSGIWKEYSSVAGIPRVDYDSYFAGTDTAFAVKLKDPVRFRDPIPLAELRARFKFEPPQSFVYAPSGFRKVLCDEFAVVAD